MEKNKAVADHERFVDYKYIQSALSVSRTKAYEIMKEMEDESPDAVFRYGRTMRIRKGVFDRWVSERCGGPPPPHVLGFATRLLDRAV